MQNRITDEINYMVERLPEPEQKLVLEIVRRFSPDDIATPEDMEDMQLAAKDLKQGRAVGHEDINWN